MAHEDDIGADWNATELSILRSAKLDSPPSGSVERTLTAVGVGASLGAGAGLGTASALGAALKVGRVAWLKWLGAALVGGGAVSALLVARQPTKSMPIAASAQVVASVPARVELGEPARAASTERVAAPSPSGSALPTPARSDGKDKREGGNEALIAEIRAIDEARDRLRRGDAQGSLQALARYDQLAKAGGSMRAEATVVRIEALLASGEKARAAALGQRFLAKNSGSPYAPYVRRILSRSD